ncbi:expressed unknown protein [Seminavis robusta]|uniref:Uncharacterized protein n=1 Tax=Seminavis robusta TaxID=568900 RepID=A0A9N8E5A0_9STRA|nr:expressed unknown protein [Seminavis robusta]|eukprot:Sro674_g185380.1 n/a (595) ;mRNA; f:32639-34423
MQDVPRGADDWKDEVVEVIQKADSLGLNLPDNKLKALAEFICGLPQITLTAITPRIVKHGFYQNGTLAEHNSESKYAFPNLDRMISTCRTTIPTTLRQKCWDDYPRLAAECMTRGMVPESVFDELGYDMDKNPDGIEVPKHQGISQEHRQRAKCLTHEAQVELRQAKMIAVEAALTRKFSECLTKHKTLSDLNKECEAKLQELVNDPQGLLGPVEPTLENFGSITAPRLKAFIHVRTFPTYTTDKGPKDWTGWPKKSSAAEAANGDRCLVRLAYDCRDKPCIMQKLVKPVKAMPQQLRHLSATIIRSSTLTFHSDAYPLASSLLADDTWRVKLIAAYRLDSETTVTVTESSLGSADYLQKRLIKRLEVHVTTKLEKSEHKENWCWNLTASKLGHVSAILILFGYVKDDLECLDETSCFLLDNPALFRLVTEEFEEDGVYMYWDTNNMQWIRVGMVALRRFWLRFIEHSKMAQLKSGESGAFYNAYPSKYAKKTVDPALRRGYHENLRQYIALGYPLAKDVKDLVDVFGFKAADNRWIKSMRYRTKNGQAIQLADQQRRALHYLIECGLKLCLAPACDISVNAGWEQATGCYGKD